MLPGLSEYSSRHDMKSRFNYDLVIEMFCNLVKENILPLMIQSLIMGLKYHASMKSKARSIGL